MIRSFLSAVQPAATLLLAAVLFVPGCRENKPSVDILSLEGKIEAINQAKREISVLYYNEKHRKEMIGVGQVTPETEIMINGAVAQLGDLRPGDRVRGEVRIEKAGGKQVQTALKIHVDRPQPLGGTPAPGASDP